MHVTAVLNENDGLSSMHRLNTLRALWGVIKILLQNFEIMHAQEDH